MHYASHDSIRKVWSLMPCTCLGAKKVVQGFGDAGLCSRFSCCGAFHIWRSDFSQPMPEPGFNSSV